MLPTETAPFFDGCATCARHSTITRCCCDQIRDLEKEIGRLKELLESNERFLQVVSEKYTDEKTIDIKNAVLWCENELAQEKQYNAELEDALIAVEVENWLAREAMQALGIDSTLPLREGIFQLAKRSRK